LVEAAGPAEGFEPVKPDEAADALPVAGRAAAGGGSPAGSSLCDDSTVMSELRAILGLRHLWTRG
jgi:hypothetical protein